MIRRGRPTTADLRRRAAKKAAWARMAARLERGDPVTWRAAIDRLGPLRAELFLRMMNSPALQFVHDKVEGGSTFGQAFEDLMLSGIPLDDDARRTIAGVMQRLANPDLAKLARDRNKLRVFREALALGEQRGEMAEQVRARLAKEFGHASGESLRKWVEKRDRERS